MNDRVRRHEEALLGESIQHILGYDNYIPRVTEYQFQQDVVFLLTNPFDRDNLNRYRQYVMELSRPLNVVDTHDQEKILFQVPPLMMSPITTIPTGEGMSADNFFSSLKRDIELNNPHINDRIAAFMQRITVVPNVKETVIIPLRAILNRYGLDFNIPGLTAAPALAAAPTGEAPRNSSFSDDYED